MVATSKVLSATLATDVTVATAWPDVLHAARSVQTGSGEQAAFDFTQED